MPEFLELIPPPQAREILLQHMTHHSQGEVVATDAALGRINATAIHAPHPLPTFPRSTVDGFAVRARDTFGCSETLPAYLRLIGEVPMGADASLILTTGQCALIHTGGMLPQGSDAVVMVEHTQQVGDDEIEVLRAVAVGENVLKAGEDVSQGQEVIPAGAPLRAAEIGGLMALGISQILVVRRPRVGIISSGDEVVPPDKEIQPGQVRDINSFSLSALVEQAGGQAVRYGIIPDRLDEIEETASRALNECDLVVITAGSSASTRDLTSQAINRLGTPGVLVHGVNVRPGKPTILAVCQGKAVIGLPGNPVSALVIARLFVVPALQRWLGIRTSKPTPSVPARLSINLPSQAGREDWIPVRLMKEDGTYVAEPVFGKSNLIFSLARADGLIMISADATGLTAGEMVEVFLL